MQIPILIEPLNGGRFRAHAGAPFLLSAEEATPAEASQSLANLIRAKLSNGAKLDILDLAQPLEPLPDDDWFFRTMREAIEENRRLEDEAAE